MMLVSGHKLLPVAVVLGLILLFLVFATKPLARFIAKIGYSIRLKMEIAIAAVAVLFLPVSLIGFGAMEYMHDGLHDIQDLMESDHRNIGSVKVAIGELEDSRHGFLFSLTPFLGLIGVFLAATLGAAMAWSVIEPVRYMGDVMRRLASADYSTPVEVANQDELGDLAESINDTTSELARLDEVRQAELRGAQLIQNTLLPKQVPEFPGWQFAAYYRPARTVGGDFYDFIDLTAGRLGLVIGDATDKGVPASLVMATTRTTLRAVAAQVSSPGKVLEQVNELLWPDIPPNMFVTCLYAVLDPASGRLEYANAGNGLPYRRHSAGVDELRATGMPLGLMPGVSYEESEAILDRGDEVLFHSDGLVEAHNGQREMFGFDRLKDVVRKYPDGVPLLGFVLDELEQFTGAG